MCVCVCVCARVHVSVSVRAFVHACACVCVCVRACVRVCVSNRERQCMCHKPCSSSHIVEVDVKRTTENMPRERAVEPARETDDGLTAAGSRSL